MKQNPDDSHTPFDTQSVDDLNATAPQNWRQRVTHLSDKLRELPQGTIVGLSAVGGALAVLFLSLGTQLLTPLPQSGVAQAPKAIVKSQQPPAASAKVFIAPEDQTASLPDVQPGVLEAAFNARNTNRPNGEAVPPEVAAETELMELRRREDQVAAERQRLEDRKRIIERELENKEIENKRLQEDKAIEQQRLDERRRLLEERQEEDKRLTEEAERAAERRIEEEKRLEEKLAAAP
jgi:DNA repair exonuclease SbcCD ATPase subunit